MSEAPTTETPVCVDPFGRGLPQDVVLRLLAGRFHKGDLTAYYRTEHFRRLREKVLDMFGSCVMCGCRHRKRLTVHYRHYKSLFREDVLRDVSCICRGCHGPKRR